MVIERETIVTIAYSDIAGQVRGKGFPERDLADRRRFGVGWTPTNIMINCFGRIPATPFGVQGDLLLVPSPDGDITLDYGDNGPLERVILGEVQNLDGTPWSCCPRAFLRRAVEALEAEAGLRLLVSFEHEFWLEGAEERPGDAYAVSSLRGLESFIGDFIGALRANAIPPDTFLPEYGPRQYEVTVDPADALTAADHAVKLREICRSVARRHGRHASFSPIVTRGIAGNGVHIHFSLQDRAGTPVSYEAGQPGGLSTVMAAFAAGILRHAPALCAVTAPSAISHERMKPHSWSAYYANIADRDREALLRICPFPVAADVDVAKRYNIEFRGADAAANPYLQLGMLIFAGLEGVKRKLPAPALSSGDPGELSEAERVSRGIGALPHSMAEGLDALEADATAMGWLGPELAKAYLMHKRGELAMTAGIDIDELCRLYARAY
jgi:glutamine synthetase